MYGALEEHVRRCFAGREVETFTWSRGPILSQNPHFRALRIAPRSADELWTYVSVGGWAATESDNHGLEFILCTQNEEASAVESLARTVYYHRGGTLGLGHTLPIGQPWLPGSVCDHLLISAPYPFTSDLSTCHIGDRHVDFVWMVPITEAERDLKVQAGLDALESHFENVGLRYWQTNRPSTV
ncbi:Suppressor of fused protein (SUFU) [Frankineae bacterium MT45]|nr:Suppressor of fused protein (SUFU) [Frankineae bacterium MT45]